MEDFFFDRVVADHDNGLRIDVTRCDEDDEEVQITVRPIAETWPRTSYFMTLAAAENLAHTLLAAVNAEMYVNPHKALAYGKKAG